MQNQSSTNTQPKPPIRLPIDPGGRRGDPEPRRPILSNAVLGMLIFVATEVMFFTALISAYLVIRAGATSDWSPPDGVYLPVLATAFNTLILFLSGFTLFRAGRFFARKEMLRAKTNLLRAVILGSFFVLFQGFEWVSLVGHGMTFRSDIFGSTFYLLIGAHGLHALGAVLAMLLLYRRFVAKGIKMESLHAMQIFWYFVVGVWPVLYGLVYF